MGFIHLFPQLSSSGAWHFGAPWRTAIVKDSSVTYQSFQSLLLSACCPPWPPHVTHGQELHVAGRHTSGLGPSLHARPWPPSTVAWSAPPVSSPVPHAHSGRSQSSVFRRRPSSAPALAPLSPLAAWPLPCSGSGAAVPSSPQPPFPAGVHISLGGPGL